MIRTITDDEIEAFWADGVVCLRGVLDPGDVAAMGPAVDALLELPEMADLSAMGDALAAGGHEVLRSDRRQRRRGRFVSGVDHWRHHDAFARFALHSALPEIVAALLRSERVQLWEDSVLVKEPGTQERTAWHQDLSYFHVDGAQLCTTWVPLDPVTDATGAVRFVKGSHRWAELFQPNLFVSTMVIPGTAGGAVPDIDAAAARGELELLSFDTDPGDLTVHHARTVHGAGPNTSSHQWRRAISVRYCGDDARALHRSGAPAKSHHVPMSDGDPLDPANCPVVWPRPARAGADDLDQ